MKIKLASVLGLAVLVASFACGSSFVYADEETSSVEQTIAAVTGDESELSCMLDSAGADICTGATKVAELDQPSLADEPTEVAAIEETPAIHSVDAVVAEVNQTVTIAAPGEDAGNGEAVATDTGSSEQPAAEPVAMLDAGTVLPSSAPAIGAADAVVVEVSQTATIAAPGQSTGENTEDSKEPAHTGSIAAPDAEPAVAIKADDLDD
jgi:hypothetical protein